ncbi:acid protease [Mycena leptocephala]|nr:acid protease [Mycena leptocephala]KAJ7886063.1 acid protease [Mycena leptocephala]
MVDQGHLSLNASRWNLTQVTVSSLHGLPKCSLKSGSERLGRRNTSIWFHHLSFTLSSLPGAHLTLGESMPSPRVLVFRGAARATFLKNKAQKNHRQFLPRDVNEPIDDEAYLYVATVLIGNPGHPYNLVIDTTSGNTWVKGGTRPTGSRVSAEGFELGFSGSEFLDQVSLAGLVMPNKSIGVATGWVESGLDTLPAFDGVLGLGPYELSIGTLQSNLSQGIPDIVQTLSCQGLVQQESFSIFMQPTTSLNSVNGEITWGGIDFSKVSMPDAFGHILNITTEFPASAYWGIDIAFLYGNTAISGVMAGIVDTGSALLYLEQNAYSRYVALTKATLDSEVTGLLTVPSINNLQNLVLLLNGGPFPLTPNAQIWPRALNVAIGGKPNQIYLVISTLGPSEGINFILGMPFLQRYYTIYNYADETFEMFTTPFTNATTN